MLAESPAAAWEPWEPDDRSPWDLRRTAHLFRRAAFGASWETLRRAIAEGPARSIDRLLRPEVPDEEAAAFERRQAGYEKAASGSSDSLRAWWLRRMLATPDPLREKMTLFWHGYFGVSEEPAKVPALLERHVSLLRAGALGGLGDLLRDLAADPATLLSIGGAAGRRSRPPEPLARALLELTLGAGSFSDEDVREAARALTGRFVLRGELRWIPREHDAGTKRILGEEGPFGADDLMRFLARRPETARRIVRKLWRWLISEATDPDDAVIAPLVEGFTAGGSIARLVETMLRSRAFFSEEAYRARVKSPVELALGLIVALEGGPPTAGLGRDLAGLGQALLRPPAGRGWEGGAAWINWFSILGREGLAGALLRGGEPHGAALEPAAVAARHGAAAPGAAARFLVDLLLGGDLHDEARRAIEGFAETRNGGGDPGAALRELTLALASCPEYQLA